jgi:hypothetical protein
MIVDLLRDEADLTVLIGPQVIFPRTVRLPLVSETDVLGRTLLAEGRRTMIAAQNQLGGRRVEEVVLFGDSQHHVALKQLLEKELSLTVRLVDPFEQVEWGDTNARKPEYPGTFAPLLGMMRDEAAGSPPVIDFLHPRKKPAPPDRRRKYGLIAAAVAAVLLIGFGFMQWQMWALDSQIGQLRTVRNKQEKASKDSVKPVKDAGALDAFTAGDVTWLDELTRLAERLPPPEAAQLTELTAQVQPKGGGQIKFTGHVDTSARVAELEDSLRDKQHSVSGKGTTQDHDLPALQWTIDELLTISLPNERTSAAPVGKPAAAPKAAGPKQGGAK